MVPFAILSLIVDGTNVLDIGIPVLLKPYLVGDLSRFQRYVG
jgi:hypothetical protein